MTKAVEIAQNIHEIAVKKKLGLIDFSPWLFRCLENKIDLCLLLQGITARHSARQPLGMQGGGGGGLTVTTSWNSYKAFHYNGLELLTMGFVYLMLQPYRCD